MSDRKSLPRIGTSIELASEDPAAGALVGKCPLQNTRTVTSIDQPLNDRRDADADIPPCLHMPNRRMTTNSNTVRSNVSLASTFGKRLRRGKHKTSDNKLLPDRYALTTIVKRVVSSTASMSSMTATHRCASARTSSHTSAVDDANQFEGSSPPSALAADRLWISVAVLDGGGLAP